MAGRWNSFSIVLIIAGCISLVALVLQIVGLSTDYLQTLSSSAAVSGTIHWGLWNYCQETPALTECFNLVDSDNKQLIQNNIVAYTSLWKFFQAVQVLGVILLATVLVLVCIQLCCMRYSAYCVGAAVVTSVLAGFFILIGCIEYALIHKDANDILKAAGTTGINNDLDYSFGLLIGAGVLTIIAAICLIVARCIFREYLERPARYPVDPRDPRDIRYDDIALPPVNNYEKPYRESRPNYEKSYVESRPNYEKSYVESRPNYEKSYRDSRPYHVTEYVDDRNAYRSSRRY